MSRSKAEYPLISIIIVVFNAEKHLKACLDSIASQPYPALEVIVIDGESTDGTLDIVKGYSHVVNFWLSEPDTGIYDAMNKGLKYVNGKWVYFLGADDVLLPDFSSLLFNELKDDRCIYYGSVIFRQQKYIGYMTKYSQAKIGINHQAMVYPASVFKRYTFNTKYRIAADRVLNMKCMRDKNFTFRFVDYILANFNDTGISTLNKDPVFEKEKFWLTFRYFGLWIGARFLVRELKKKYKKA